MSDTSMISIRIPTELLERIGERADALRRSRNAEIVHMLEKTLEQSEKSDKEALRILEVGQRKSSQK